MSIVGIFVIMFCTVWFGGTFVYFARYLDKNSDYQVSSINIILSFLGDLKNIVKFYKLFINSHPANKRSWAIFLFSTHVISPIVFWLVVIIEAMRSGGLSFY